MQIKLSDAIPTILDFDGQVLECFFDEGGSKRVHVSHIKGVNMDAQDHQGKRLLTVQLKHDQLLLWVDAARVPQINALLAALHKDIKQ